MFLPVIVLTMVSVGGLNKVGEVSRAIFALIEMWISFIYDVLVPFQL
jgi:hypothetical protein